MPLHSIKTENFLKQWFDITGFPTWFTAIHKKLGCA
jgi:hypothetical protein